MLARHIFEVLVDTGFNGSLILPSLLVKELELKFERNLVEYYSVTGEVFLVSPCPMKINWLGREITVLVATSDQVTEALLGSHMLKGCRLTIDYSQRTVAITKS